MIQQMPPYRAQFGKQVEKVQTMSMNSLLLIVMEMRHL